MWMAEADALCRSVDPRRAGSAVRARAAAARRRLLVQSDRPDRPVHAALEHPDRGAQAPRLLRGRRLRRQHRVAHAGRSDAGGGPRDPAPRSRGVPDDDRADRSMRRCIRSTTRRRSTRSGRRWRSIRQAAGGEVDFSADPRRSLSALAEEIRAVAGGRRTRGSARRPPTPAERRRLNAVLRRIARLLVPLNYARGERFDHDPALKFGAVPRLEAAASLASAPAGAQAVYQGGAGARSEQGARDDPCRSPMS